MHGNIREWCLDWYGGINSDPATDFPGATSSSGRVVRGGDWGYGNDYARSSIRYYINPDSRHNNYGFSLSRTLANE